MSVLNQVVRGVRQRRPRIMIYGTPGVGKSSFAAAAQDPVFIGAEDGVQFLDVARLPIPASWAEFTQQINALEYEKHDFKTLVIDTADSLENLIATDICTKNNKSHLVDLQWGRGNKLAFDYWIDLLKSLERINEKGMSVIVVAHATTRDFRDPAGKDYDRWEPKLHKEVWPLLVQWSDVTGFARRRAFTDDDGKAKSVGTRELCVNEGPGFIAKARAKTPMKDPIPLGWKEFATAYTEANK